MCFYGNDFLLGLFEKLRNFLFSQLANYKLQFEACRENI